MAHNLEFNESTQTHNMFCVGDVTAAWHHLGQRTDKTVNWEKAMSLAGLNWEVILHPMFARVPVTADPSRKVVEISTHKLAFRSTDGAQLGVVGTDYHVIQNRYAFDYVDSLLQAENGAHYESAGALGHGERIWCLARVPGSDFSVLGVDPHQTYLLFTTAHDGSMSAMVKLTDVRVVCQNTLTQALSHAGAFFKFRHTKNVEQRVVQAKQAMAGVTVDAKSLAEKLNTLATRKVTRESLTAIMERLFPKPQGNSSQTRRDNLVTAVLELYESNDSNAIPAIRGSAYNLLNAVTQYTDHFRTARVTPDRKSAGYDVTKARAENALWGTGDSLKTDAVSVILEATTNAPAMPRIASTTVSQSAVAVAEPVTAEPSFPTDLQSKIDDDIAYLDENIA